jgi:hypothetical protein
VTITASFAGNEQFLASTDSSQGSIVAPQVVLKTPTTVVLSPSSFSLESNGTQVLNASVQDSHGNVLAGTVTWALNPASTGSLSSTSGASVTYTAPAVQQNTTVTIIAAFAGDDTYLGSRGSSAGTVTPPSILSYTYIMKFDNATMTNVQVNGPIMMNGTSVALLKAESADMFGWNLSHFGLTASEMDVDDLAVYVTYVKGYCPELGGALGITGGQSINLGPVASATFSNTTFYVVRMEGDSANLTSMAAVSENVGGSEPYVPSIITAPSAAMTHLYSITGPTTWGALTGLVSNITTGRIDLSQFAIKHPIAYSLDRQGNTYTATEEWSLTASSATGLNVSAFVVYFQVTGGEMVVVTATGEDNIFNMIPFGLNTGGSFTALDATVEPVYFAAQQLTLGSFVLSIGG